MINVKVTISRHKKNSVDISLLDAKIDFKLRVFIISIPEQKISIAIQKEDINKALVGE